ncbi:MAG TPA: hypothetical protein PKW98_01410 [Candidatus Wallbacteria bacterium]|nr:MAG: hypothetical protein BWY32_00750 [bacterium ADurb.Bin243]HOD39396.1 hypothetical protein [Candidatus Wallbacteria bacterium]HPG56448.1 hypothetical protein [Candidatus Wallbacteria bacterium]
MFEGISNGWDMFKESIKVFMKYPVMIFPLLFVWCVYAPMILYMKYGLKWEKFSGGESILIVTAFIFAFAFLLAMSCSVLLELIQQIESGKSPDLLKAVFETLALNLVKMIPIVIVWTVLWVLLTIISALIRRKNEEDDSEFNAENAAKTLAGADGEFSFSSYFIDALKKGVRMIVFLILPGIAWENRGCFDAVKKGLSVFRLHLYEFTSGFVLTELASFIIFFPVALMFALGSAKKGRPPIIVFPEQAWYLAMVYIAFAWSYTIYLEQMFVAELYLWHIKWEREFDKLRASGDMRPFSFYDVKRPSLLDDTPDLVENLSASTQEKIVKKSPWNK